MIDCCCLLCVDVSPSVLGLVVGVLVFGWVVNASVCFLRFSVLLFSAW